LPPSFSRNRVPRELSASVGAPGPHDFAVRTSAARLAPLPRPPHPCPTSVTIAIRPSDRAGTVRTLRLIRASEKAKYFLRGGWTGFCAREVICPTGRRFADAGPMIVARHTPGPASANLHKRRPLHSRWQTLGLRRQPWRADAPAESRGAKVIASGKIAAAVIAVAIMAPCDPTASPNIPKRIGAVAPAPIVQV